MAQQNMSIGDVLLSIANQCRALQNSADVLANAIVERDKLIQELQARLGDKPAEVDLTK